MSYDISLIKKIGNVSTEIFSVNITSNVRSMYNAAFNTDYWVDLVDDQLCKHVKDRVSRAVKRMKDKESKIRQFEPANGWGKYEDALRVLTEFNEAVKEFPECTIQILK